MDEHMEQFFCLLGCFFFVVVVCLFVGCRLVFSQLPPLADGAVLLSGLGAGGSGYGLHRGGQGAEEASDEGEAETAPGAEHGPAVAVADVVGQTVQVPWVTRKLKIDASNAGAEGDDAEGSCNDRTHDVKGEKNLCQHLTMKKHTLHHGMCMCEGNVRVQRF